MPVSLTETFNIKQLIETENIKVFYQPIISIKQKTIIGMEALCRGFINSSSNLIPPDMMFALAERENTLLELDRFCRKKAIETFTNLNLNKNDYLLFLNINTAIIDKGVVGSGNLINNVNDYGLNPNNVVIEILEASVENIDDLQKFTNLYRDYGFLIAIDDIGAGSSNLSRIPLIGPDILKVDRWIIRDIQKDYYKQEVFKSIINLARKIGALVVAEGIETEEEAMVSLEFGADMLQGYYFSRPREISTGTIISSDMNFFSIADKFKAHMTDKIKNCKYQIKEFEKLVDKIIMSLISVSKENINNYLNNCLNKNPFIECIYILNDKGIQISDTVCNPDKMLKQKRLIFHPAPKGTDHSLKDYFIFINAGLKKFVTDKYISLASGNLCQTITKIYESVEGDKLILCVDINSSEKI